MIKKFAFALGVTTICANIHPTAAFPRSSPINLDDNDGVKVARVLRAKRLIEQPEIKRLKKRIDAERIKARKRILQTKRMTRPERVVERQHVSMSKRMTFMGKMKEHLFFRMAKRMTFMRKMKEHSFFRMAKRVTFMERMIKGQAIRMAKTTKGKFEEMIAKSRLHVKGSANRKKQFPTPLKLAPVHVEPEQKLLVPLMNDDFALSKPSAVLPTVNPGPRLREDDAGSFQHLKEASKQVRDNNGEESSTFKLKEQHNGILSHIIPEELVEKQAYVSPLTLPKVEVSKAPNASGSGNLGTPEPLISRAALPESLIDLQKNAVLEEPSIQDNRLVGMPAQLEVTSETEIAPQLLGVHKVSSAAQFVEKKEELLDASVETIKAAFVSVESGISQVKEMLQDSKSVITEKIAEVVPEFLHGLSTPENTTEIVQEEPVVEKLIQDVQPEPVAVKKELVVENLIQDVQPEPIVVHEEPAVQKQIQDVQPEPVAVHEEPAVQEQIQDVQLEPVAVKKESVVENLIQDVQPEPIIVHEELAVQKQIQDVQPEPIIVHEEPAVQKQIQDVQPEPIIVHEEPAVQKQIQDVQPEPIIVHEEPAVQKQIQGVQLEPIIVHEEPAVQKQIQDVQLEPIVVHEEPAVQKQIQDVQPEPIIVHEEPAVQKQIQDVQPEPIVVHEEPAVQKQIQDVQPEPIIVHEEPAVQKQIQDVQPELIVVHEEPAVQKQIQDVQPEPIVVHEEPAVQKQIQGVQPEPIVVHEEPAVQKQIQDVQPEPIVVHEEPAVQQQIQDVQPEPIIVHEEPAVQNLIHDVQAEKEVYEESKNEIKDEVDYLKDEFSKITVILNDSVKKLDEFKEVFEENPIKDVQSEMNTPEDFTQENLTESNHSDADLFDIQLESLSSSLIREKNSLDLLSQWIQKTGFYLYFSPKEDSEALRVQKHTAQYLINSLENIKTSFASLESDLRNDLESTPEDLIMKRARLESLKEFFNDITDKAYDQQSRITFTTDPSPIETDLDTSSDTEEDTSSDTEDDVFTFEATSSEIPETTLDFEQEVARSIVHPVSLDADLFDTLVTSVESKVEDLTNGLTKIKEESYNGYFPNYFGKKYSILGLEDQKQIVESLWSASENLSESFGSLESHVKSSDESEQENLIEAKKRVAKLKDAFETVTTDLAWIKISIDDLEPKTDSPVEVTAQEIENTPSVISTESSLKSEPLERLKEEAPSYPSVFLSESQTKSVDLSTSQPLSRSTFQPIKICGKVFGSSPSVKSESQLPTFTSGRYSLKISGKEVSYDLKDKDKGSRKILSSPVAINKGLLDSGSSSIRAEKKIEPSALQSSVILSQKLGELGAQVDLLLNIGEATDSSDFESDKRLIMSSSRSLRGKLEGNYMADLPSAKDFIEELNLLKSSLQNYTPPTEEVVAEGGETTVSTWVGFVTFWAGKILDKLKLY